MNIIYIKIQATTTYEWKEVANIARTSVEYKAGNLK